MGFLDEAGNALGKMLAVTQEIQGYKLEYQMLTNDELWQEYYHLKKKLGTEYKNRFLAVETVLRDRGCKR